MTRDIHHEWVEMLQQRLFGIALGHPDCNDSRSEDKQGVAR